jgi:hypothetical protein
MQQYRQILEVESNESSAAARVLECDNWDELAELVHVAEMDYTHSGSVIRRLGRAFGDYTSALHALAGLLPTDSNFSIMSGGVKLLLTVSGIQRSLSASINVIRLLGEEVLSEKEC